MSQRAIFLDRDGTLVHAEHYPSRPEQLRLYDNLGPGLRALQAMNFSLVVITNQAGIAHAYFTEVDLQRMHKHLTATLAAIGVHLTAIYYCPHHPAGCLPQFSFPCSCRKPQPGLLFRAASDLNIDLEQSWFIGDILDDVEAGNRAGCRTVLVDLGTELLPASVIRYPTFVAPDTRQALEIIKTVESLTPELYLTYRPHSWQAVECQNDEYQ